MLVDQLVVADVKPHPLRVEIGVEDTHLRNTGTDQTLGNSLLGYLEGRLTDRHVIEDLIEMGDTVCHLVVLSDDMCHHRLFAILP